MSRRLTPALLFSCVLVGMAPFLGELREWLRDRLEGSFAVALAIVFAVVVLLLVGATMARRDRLGVRLAWLGLWLVLMAAQLVLWARGGAETTAVERMHYLFYSVASVLFYRALARDEDLGGLVDAFLATLLVSIADESMQWLMAVRSADVMDLALNAYSSLAGLSLALAVQPPPRGARLPRLRRLLRSGGVAAVVVLAFATYFDVAHSGHHVVDAEVGGFRSFRTASQLLETRDRRAVEWASRPLERPAAIPPWAIEDYYRTEAGWHVLVRNAAFHEGDLAAAWHENRILERWYTPFLDQVGDSGAAFRLPPEELALLESGVPVERRGGYESPVGRSPRHSIWLRPTRSELWVTATLLAAVLWLASRREGLSSRFASRRRGAR